MTEFKHPILTVPFKNLREMMMIDVSHLTESRFNLDYLPWAEAELLLREYFPNFKVISEIEEIVRGDVVYVMVKAHIIDMVTGYITLDEYFPVMDGSRMKNAVPNPDTRQITDAIKRASVKVIARETGLGLSLYRKEKEDVPEERLERENRYSEVMPSVSEASVPVKNRFTKKII